MNENQYLPEPARLSVLVAILLLTFALERVLNMPQETLSLPLFGFVWTIPVGLGTILSSLAAILTAIGTDWLLRSHPNFELGKARGHWLLPILSVLTLGAFLNSLTETYMWWLAFGIGALLIALVLTAEFIALEPTDARYPIAVAGLTVLAFALFLILTVSVRASGWRLFLVAPFLFTAGFLVSLRTLHLRLGERWETPWAIGIGLVTLHLGAALHYWPLTPLQYGLALLAPVYALTILSVSLADGLPFRVAIVEPAIMGAVLASLLLWFR
ncbi:MAG: hypothetical protein NZL98_04570 [Anaerolineales bacterium]|nr:hypothetical protein [Anaerolineales bacterium]MDW8226240.1 hypothetical protein [Anaerolineales bacterium]